MKNASEQIDVSPGNYRLWKHRNAVPPKWHFDLAEAAQKAGINLTVKDLHEWGRR